MDGADMVFFLEILGRVRTGILAEAPAADKPSSFRLFLKVAKPNKAGKAILKYGRPSENITATIFQAASIKIGIHLM